MHLSTVILPVERWSQARKWWVRAEELGFHAAYTYDHLSWRDLRDGPWFDAMPTLTAAATVTERIRLGTMVTSPNFRHPVPLAKELMSLDDISGGRLTVGVGAGGTGFDATVLGQEKWTPAERADRLGEFVPLLDKLLTQESTTHEGRYYSAIEARMLPGCVQTPRIPLYVAATGPRGLKLTAEYGQGWVTDGDPADPADPNGMPVKNAPSAVAAQIEKLTAACAAVGRDAGELEKVILLRFSQKGPAQSLDAFVDWAGRYQDMGITEIVVHWPVAHPAYATDPVVFERIATEAPAQLG